ncbi:MAG: hypothetical protein ACR2II_11260 [Chthoniobacterales bacterium]
MRRVRPIETVAGSSVSSFCPDLPVLHHAGEGIADREQLDESKKGDGLLEGGAFGVEAPGFVVFRDAVVVLVVVSRGGKKAGVPILVIAVAGHPPFAEGGAAVEDAVVGLLAGVVRDIALVGPNGCAEEDETESNDFFFIRRSELLQPFTAPKLKPEMR